MRYYLVSILFFLIFSYSLGNEEVSISHSGYSNIYGVNRISDGSLIKLPFRLFSYDLNISYNDFSIHTKWGIEHKIQSFNAGQPLSDLVYDLTSFNNVDYKAQFREYYISFFPSFGEIKFGKQIHSWGATDVSSPIDILNPIDYYYLFTDTDETKIGRNSLLVDLYSLNDLPIKIEFILMPNHIPNNIPSNDPDFPITLPANVEQYQFLEKFEKHGLGKHFVDPIEYGGYLQYSLDNMDWTLYYFSGYDRNFNLYGANVFSDAFDINTVTDTVFSYRKTEMYALSNVSFIGGLTFRTDFAYFETDAGDQLISDREYAGTDPISQYLDFSNNLASSYFNIASQYYQYSIQLEYTLPFDVDFTSQVFGFKKIKVDADVIDVELTNFEIYLDGKDFFYPGMGSSMATLAKNGLLLNFQKALWDDAMEFQLTNLFDTKDKGNLFQFKWTYSVFDNLNLSLLYYQGKGNKSKYPDNPDTDSIDESLFYPFNAMEDFSHIRAQFQYFF